MKIRKANKKDFKEYLKLKREEEKDYSKIIREKIVYPRDSVMKKEFNKFNSTKDNIVFVVENKQILVGYLHGSYFNNSYKKGGFIEDIFVTKRFRGRGLAKSLINYFTKTVKAKKYDVVQLSVNPKNNVALNLYKKLGFEIYHFSLKKKIK